MQFSDYFNANKQQLAELIGLGRNRPMPQRRNEPRFTTMPVTQPEPRFTTMPVAQPNPRFTTMPVNPQNPVDGFFRNRPTNGTGLKPR